MSSSQGKTRVEGAKRAEILAAATERFGRDGYEHTKWADIAADVGVGPTALYHYFESKQHCLYVIMERRSRTSARASPRSPTATATVGRARRGDARLLRPLRAVTCCATACSSPSRGCCRPARSSPREEEARQAARARTRDLEFAWASFLDRAMQQGAIPRTTRA